MITKFANIMADFFINNNIVKYHEREIYRYGTEVIISVFINFFIVFLCGIILGEIIAAIVFFYVFLLLRRYCGGYHADTYLKCNLIFSANIVFVLICIKNSEYFNNLFVFFSTITSVLLTIALSPIINKNKPLSENKIGKYRKLSIFIMIIMALLVYFLLLVSRSLALTISLSMFSVSVAMLIEKIKIIEVKKNVSKSNY